MSIRACTFSCEITPEEDVTLFGFPGSKRVSTGVRDPLMVEAIHLRGGSGGIIIISLDLLNISPEFINRLRKEIGDATGTKEQNIFIGTSQNHSGPVTNHALCRFSDPSYSEPDNEYMEHIIDRTVHAASEAVVSSRPAAVATITLDQKGTGAIIVKDTVYGKVLGLIIVHQEKANRLGSGNTEISADFLGVLRQKLSRSFGGDTTIAYFTAPCAALSSEINPDEFGEDAAKETGLKLAKMIVSKIKNLTNDDFFSNIIISGELSPVDLKRTNFLDGIEANTLLSTMSKMNSDTEHENEVDDWTKLRTRNIVNLMSAQKQGVLDEIIKHYKTANIHTIKIGPVKILGIPCSILPEAGKQIIESVGDNTWIAENVNGEMQESILSKSDKQDSYTLLSTLFEPETGRLLVNTALSLNE